MQPGVRARQEQMTKGLKALLATMLVATTAAAAPAKADDRGDTVRGFFKQV